MSAAAAKRQDWAAQYKAAFANEKLPAMLDDILSHLDRTAR